MPNTFLMITKNKNKHDSFKPFENPSYTVIHIQNREIIVKITLNDFEGLSFSVEFTFEKKVFKKEFEKISSKEKIYDFDEIEFNGLDLHQIDKAKIAHCLNAMLDFHFS